MWVIVDGGNHIWPLQVVINQNDSFKLYKSNSPSYSLGYFKYHFYIVMKKYVQFICEMVKLT